MLTLFVIMLIVVVALTKHFSEKHQEKLFREKAEASKNKSKSRFVDEDDYEIEIVNETEYEIDAYIDGKQVIINEIYFR